MKKYVFLITYSMVISFGLTAQIDSTQRINAPAAPTMSKKPVRYLADNKNTIKLNMLSPFYSNLSVFYQRVISNDYSLQLGASYMDFSGLFGNTSNSSMDYTSRDNEVTTLYSVTPEFRYNLTGQYLSGTYFGSFLRYMQMQYEFDETVMDPISYKYLYTQHLKYQYTTLGIGVLIGSQVLYKRKITIDVYAGPVYNILLQSSNSVTSNNDLVKSDDIPGLFIRGYGIRAGFSVGFAF